MAESVEIIEVGPRDGLQNHDSVVAPAVRSELVRRLLDRARVHGRADDTPEVIRHRLQVFAESSGPLIDYYRHRGILVEVDGDQPPDAITADIQDRLP